MESVWKSIPRKFSIFLCNVSNNMKHWYISIVPVSGSTGTSSDIDFHAAPMTAESTHVPPKSGWIKAVEGKDPAPRLVHRYANAYENDGPMSGVVIEDDDNNEQPQQQGSYV
jgi:hypothetical protein